MAKQRLPAPEELRVFFRLLRHYVDQEADVMLVYADLYARGLDPRAGVSGGVASLGESQTSYIEQAIVDARVIRIRKQVTTMARQVQSSTEQLGNVVGAARRSLEAGEQQSKVSKDATVTQAEFDESRLRLRP